MSVKLPLLLLCLVFFPAWGTDEIDDFYFDLSLEELLAVEVSGASFSLETLAYTPASVTVFTAKEIQQLGARYLRDLTNMVPGFQSKRQGESGGLFSISGRGRQIGTSTRSVKIIINGQAITSGYVGSSIGSITTIPLDNVSKVEFIRGPGSVVYGSGALMGIVNVETYQQQNFAQLSFGNHDYASSVMNYYRQGLQFSAIFRGDLGERYSLKNVDTGNRVSAKDPYSESHFYLTKSTQQSRLQLHHHRNISSGFYSLDRVDNDLNTSDRQYTMASYNHRFNLNDYFDISSSVFLNVRRNQFSARLSAPGALASISHPSSSAAIEAIGATKSKQFGAKLVADWIFIDGHLSVGGEYLYSDPVSGVAFSNFNLQQLSDQQFPVDYYDNEPLAVPFIRPNENHTFAIFSEFQQQVTSKFNSIYSLRFDYAENIGEGEVLPRLAFIYELNERNFIKAFYSQAFRNPDAIELGTINNSSLLGNDDLTSETITSTEVVWFSQHSRFYLSLAYFYNQIENSIEQTSIQGTRVFLNHNKENNDGFELEYQHELNARFSVRTSFSRIFNMFDSSFRVSDTTGSITLNWKHRRWQVNASSMYLSDTEMLMNANNDRLTLPSYWYHNATINYQHNDQLHSQFLINNLQNRHYLTATVSTTLDEGIPSRGRELLYSLKLRF